MRRVSDKKTFASYYATGGAGLFILQKTHLNQDYLNQSLNTQGLKRFAH